MPRPHWSQCSHPAIDRDGYCNVCGDLRRIVKTHPGPVLTSILPHSEAMKQVARPYVRKAIIEKAGAS